MKKTAIICVLLFVLTSQILSSCTMKEKTLGTTESLVTSETPTSQETESITETSETTPYETTTAPIIYEEIYVSESFPDVNIIAKSENDYTLSIEIDDVSLIEEVEFSHDLSYFSIYRVDYKVIS